MTGDLAHKLVFPALYAMVKRRVLGVPIVGAAGLADGARVIVEEPFGRDPASARKLMTLLHVLGCDVSLEVSAPKVDGGPARDARR